MITIYNFWRGIRGVRVAWQCEEMRLVYEAVGFDFPVPAEHRAKYPPGSVPFLEDQGGVAIGESVAQMLYLAWRLWADSAFANGPRRHGAAADHGQQRGDGGRQRAELQGGQQTRPVKPVA